MTTLQPIVFAFDSHAVRSLVLEEAPWFVAKDVCAILDIEWKGSGSTGSLAHLDDDEKRTEIIPSAGGPQETSIISESGLYTLIFKSRKPEARRFRKWVTSEVLPAIRRQGKYGSGDNGQIIGLLVTLVERMDQRDVQLMTFMAAQASGRRRPKSKVRIMREHEARALALQTEGLNLPEISEALGISETSVSLLLHRKYPFSADQQIAA